MVRDKLKQDVITSLKGGDKGRVEVLRYVISLIDKKELQLPPGKMDETSEMGVLKKEFKDKEESRAMFEKAGRSDLVAQLDYEMRILKEYLPEDIGEEEIKKIVDRAADKVGNNFGMVMKEVMSMVGGRASGQVVSKAVNEKLNSNKTS